MTDNWNCDGNIAPFAGMMPTSPTPQSRGRARHLAPKAPSRSSMSFKNSVPLVLVGSLAMAGVHLGGAEAAQGKLTAKPKPETSDLREAVREALARATPATTAEAADAMASGILALATVPSTYRVVTGDTVSRIAGRHGLSTAAVLALNGLGWKSLIFPGQVLKLTAAPAPVPAPAPAPGTSTPPPTGSITYTIRSGDTINSIARRHGVSTASVLSANGLGWSSIIYPRQTITIPGQAVPAPTPAPPPTPPADPPAESEQPPAPAPAPVPAPAPEAPSATYVIKSGDTVGAIARKFGVSIQSILDANGLVLSSIIYTGRTLVIPGVQPAQVGDTITLLSPEMSANATIIVRVGQELGVSEYGIVIALAAAMQESSLRNINYGHLDSVGLFQQRPSSGWGTVQQLTDPAHAARLFYGGPSNPNKGKTRGLLDISGWQSMTVTKAAQSVQISAYPNAYAKWETSARAWYTLLK